MKIALTIAGSDSSGGAGLQQDLRVFSSLGVHGVSVVTAVTAQNTKSVVGSYCLDAKIVEEQLDALFSDIKIDAVKTGMLGNREIVEIVYEKLRDYEVKNLVVDPVMMSTSGDKLLEEDALPSLKKLISLAKITTPNRKEAKILSGIKIDDGEEVGEVARKIGCRAVVITGGDSGGRDFFYHKNEAHSLKSSLNIKEKIHGTGCAFSSAITANLAKGFSLPDAVKEAKHFMNCSLARNFAISKGRGLRIADTGNIKIYKDFKDSEKQEVVEKVAGAIELFCSSKNSWKLIPEVGVNIVFALPEAKNISEVVGLTGRIIRDRGMAIPVGIVNFSGSSHVARVVLEAMKFDREIRAGMNIKFSDEILRVCREIGLEVATFDRKDEPDNKKTMSWGTREAIEKFDQVPAIIYDEGGKGKEAMVRILGKNPGKVVKIVIKILKEMS